MVVVFQCKTDATDTSNNIRKFYSQISNILFVTGKSPQELRKPHPVKTYCLTVLCMVVKTDKQQYHLLYKVNVAWNNCFQRVFTARCTIVQSAVLRSHVVCLSVCDVGGS